MFIIDVMKQTLTLATQQVTRDVRRASVMRQFLSEFEEWRAFLQELPESLEEIAAGISGGGLATDDFVPHAPRRLLLKEEPVLRLSEALDEDHRDSLYDALRAILDVEDVLNGLRLAPFHHGSTRLGLQIPPNYRDALQHGAAKLHHLATRVARAHQVLYPDPGVLARLLGPGRR